MKRIGRRIFGSVIVLPFAGAAQGKMRGRAKTRNGAIAGVAMAGLLMAGLAWAQQPGRVPRTGGILACEASLAETTTNLGACNGGLGTCTGDLTTCNGELGTCNADLSAANARLTTCTGDLEACTGDLAACEASHGPSAAYTNYGDGFHTIARGLTQTVASVTVPVGSYVLSGAVQAIGVGDGQFVQCSFVSGGGIVHGLFAVLVDDGAEPMLADVTVGFFSNPIFLRCNAQGGTARAAGQMIATKVGTVIASD